MKILSILVYAFLLFVMFGCSLFGGGKSKKVELIEMPPPRILQSLPETKPAGKEPGSLWSEDSKWNNIYDVAPARQPGDIITIKVQQGLKAQIARVVSAKTGKSMEEIKAHSQGTSLAEIAQNEAKAANPKAEDKKGDRKPAGKKAEPEADKPDTQAANTPQKDVESKKVEATILEVLPRGMFRISANQGLHVGGPEEPFVALEGNVREKEIAPDDTVSSDALLAVKLDVVDYSKPNVLRPGQKEPKGEGK